MVLQVHACRMPNMLHSLLTGPDFLTLWSALPHPRLRVVRPKFPRLETPSHDHLRGVYQCNRMSFFPRCFKCVDAYLTVF